MREADQKRDGHFWQASAGRSPALFHLLTSTFRRCPDCQMRDPSASSHPQKAPLHSLDAMCLASLVHLETWHLRQYASIFEWSSTMLCPFISQLTGASLMFPNALIACLHMSSQSLCMADVAASSRSNAVEMYGGCSDQASQRKEGLSIKGQWYKICHVSCHSHPQSHWGDVSLCILCLKARVIRAPPHSFMSRCA